MFLRRFFFFVLALAFWLSPQLCAQSVRWDPPSGQFSFNKVSHLSLVFTNCQPDGNVDLPKVDGLEIGRNPSRSSQIQIDNFNMGETYSLDFPVRPTMRNSITIPGFDIKTDKGKLHVAPASYTVGNATIDNTDLMTDNIATAQVFLPKNTIWSGEVIPITYTLSLARPYFHSPATLVQWDAAPMVTEEWTSPESSETLVCGKRGIAITQTTHGFAKKPGKFTLNPTSQVANLIVGQAGFGFFSAPAIEQKTITSPRINLTVKPLPAPTDNFSGAVGKFTFSSKVVPTSASIGEPITWTLELSGSGNWPDIKSLPLREVSTDFQVIQPKSERKMKDSSLFNGTLTKDAVLVPTKAGPYILGPVGFTYFDTESGTYKTIATDTVTVQVSAAPSSTQTPANGPVQSSLNVPKAAKFASNALPLPKAVAPKPPEKLPRSPLPDSSNIIFPVVESNVTASFLAILLAIPVIAWLILATLRSRATDPLLPQRNARGQLIAILQKLSSSAQSAPSVLDLSLIHAWQTHTCQLWDIGHAAPTPAEIAARVAETNFSAAPAWTELWREVDRALHSSTASLPPDWISRALAAAESASIRTWSFWSAFAPHNLVPFVFALLVVATSSPLYVWAASGAAHAYEEGNFPAAEAAWRDVVKAHPHDWIARHNLGLALAQQDRWAEATAHWTSAFLQHPRGSTTSWDLTLGLERSGMAPPKLVDLVRGSANIALPRLASPGEWHALLLVFPLLIAAALVLFLLRGYQRLGAWAQSAAFVALIAATLLACLASLSLHAYGQFANPEVALIWKSSLLRSIPTDAYTTQKTSPVSPGTFAIVTKTFLSWSQLRFESGQTGWVPIEDFIKIYR